MAILLLETVVLRGVVAECDGTAVAVRPGASVKASPTGPGVSNPMRHPRPGGRLDDSLALDPDVVSGVLPGAGRSRRWSGSAPGSLRSVRCAAQGHRGGRGTASAPAPRGLI